MGTSGSARLRHASPFRRWPPSSFRADAFHPRTTSNTNLQPRLPSSFAHSMSSKAFLNTITARRSIYQLNRQLPEGVTDASIQELVKEVIKQTPSAVRHSLPSLPMAHLSSGPRWLPVSSLCSPSCASPA